MPGRKSTAIMAIETVTFGTAGTRPAVGGSQPGEGRIELFAIRAQFLGRALPDRTRIRILIIISVCTYFANFAL